MQAYLQYFVSSSTGPLFALPLYYSYYSNLYSPWIITVLVLLFFAVMLGVLILKGCALWHAARGSQKWWFIALLVINTMGILEIIYLIWFRIKTKSPIIESAPVHTSSPQ